MLKFISSRKFMVTVAGVIIAIGNDYFGLHLSKDTVLEFTAMIITYILGQSHVDAKKQK